jgi:antitoxin component YwqK of YwqJK toxin-antitoxin module
MNWYPDGRKWRERHYSQGKQSGPELAWDENGREWLHKEWRDGKEISSNVASDQPDGPVTRGTFSLR